MHGIREVDDIARYGQREPHFHIQFSCSTGTFPTRRELELSISASLRRTKISEGTELHEKEVNNLKMLVCRLGRLLLSCKRAQYGGDEGEQDYAEATERDPSSIIDEILGDSSLAHELVDSDDEILEIVASSNAFGWIWDTHDDVLAAYMGFPDPSIVFTSRVYFTGEQDTGKTFCGDHIIALVHGQAEFKDARWEVTELRALSAARQDATPTYRTFEASLKCGLSDCPLCEKDNA